MRVEAQTGEDHYRVSMAFTPLFDGRGTLFFYPVGDCRLFIRSPVQDTIGKPPRYAAMLSVYCQQSGMQYIEWEVEVLGGGPCELEGMVTLDSLKIGGGLHRFNSGEVVDMLGEVPGAVIRNTVSLP